MIRKLITFLMIPSLIVAIFLSIGGVQSIPFDSPYMYSFFKVVALRFQNFHIQIPSIPKIPFIEYADGSGVWAFVLNALIFIIRLLTIFVNGLASIINTIGAVINFLLSFLEYSLIFIYSLKDLRNGLISAGL